MMRTPTKAPNKIYMKTLLNKINNIMVDYLADLDIVNKHQNNALTTIGLSLLSTLIHCDFLTKNIFDKYIGFNLLYHAWLLTRKPNTMAFDIMFRYIFIDLYIAHTNFIKNKIGNVKSSSAPKFMRFMAYGYGFPNIKIPPFYLETFRQFKRLHQDVINNVISKN